MKVRVLLLGAAAFSLALGACFVGIDTNRPLRPTDAGTDAPGDAPGLDVGPDAPPPGECDATVPFGELEPVLPSATASQFYARIAPSGVELYFGQWVGSAKKMLYRSVRATTADPWGPPALVNELSLAPDGGQVEVVAASLTGDGLTAYLQWYVVPSPWADLYVTERATTSSPWSTPKPVPGVSDPGGADDAPWVSSDGDRIYFFTGPQPYRVVVTERVGGVFGFPRAVPLLPGDSRTPVLTEDELTIFFSGLRPLPDGGLGVLSVFVARRGAKTDPFGAPELVPELSVSWGRTFPTWVSKDGCSILVTREIAGRPQIFFARRPR